MTFLSSSVPPLVPPRTPVVIAPDLLAAFDRAEVAAIDDVGGIARDGAGDRERGEHLRLAFGQQSHAQGRAQGGLLRSGEALAGRLQGGHADDRKCGPLIDTLLAKRTGSTRWKRYVVW